MSAAAKVAALAELDRECPGWKVRDLIPHLAASPTRWTT
jgi:hypothetical protein